MVESARVLLLINVKDLTDRLNLEVLFSCRELLRQKGYWVYFSDLWARDKADCKVALLYAFDDTFVVKRVLEWLDIPLLVLCDRSVLEDMEKIKATTTRTMLVRSLGDCYGEELLNAVDKLFW